MITHRTIGMYTGAADRDPTSQPGLGRITRLALSFLVTAVALTVVALILFRLRVVAVSALIALMIAAALDPAVGWVQGHGVRRGWVAGGSLLLLAALLAMVGGWVIPQVWGASGNLGAELSKAAADTRDWLATGPLHLSLGDLRRLGEDLGLLGGGGGTSVLRGLTSGAVTIAELLEGGVLTAVFSLYFLVRGDGYAAWVIDLCPSDRRSTACRIAATTRGSLGAYARAITVNGAVNATMLGVALWLLGVPIAAALALIAFVAGFFPVVGTIAAGLLAALVALASQGPVEGAVVVAVVALVHHLELYVIGPYVVGRSVRLHPVAVVLALAVGASLAGVMGLFLAPPALVVAIAIVRVLRPPPDAEKRESRERGELQQRPEDQVEESTGRFDVEEVHVKERDR